MPDTPIHLQIDGLNASYGESHVLHDVSLQVRRGEIVALLGRNGAGRTTLLRAVTGLIPMASGAIYISGVQTLGLAPHRIAGLGVGYCPEERGIFSSLTCHENMLLPPIVAVGGMGDQELRSLFPNLFERANSMGTKLSGGEQQMLALARIFRTGAKLLLLDEISEGLAPVIVQSLSIAVSRLRDLGFTVLLVEQNFRFTEKLADKFYVLEEGRVITEFERSALPSMRSEVACLLGV